MFKSIPARGTMRTLGTLLFIGIVTCVTTAHSALPYSVTFRNFFGSMTFTRPVQFLPYPGEDSAYVVVQQNGRLITVRRVNNAWSKSDSAVIPVLGGTSGGNEQGLLGLAFHPNYRQNRKYYAYYVASGSDNGFNQIVERTADSTLRPRTTDAQKTILRLRDPYDNHNGGTIAFGTDGYLYFGLGDGGSGGDPQNRASNLDSLFGKMLRFDVNGVDAYPSDTTRNYAIPTDNPFVGQANRRPEIWAYGLRNPFRWSFHPTTGELWAGDVGQEVIEEVSRVTKGANMGWRTLEGNTCYNTADAAAPLSNCTRTGATPAVISIERSQGRSMTGGTFFMGNPSSAYHGVYFFGDYATDSVWAARIVNDSVTERIRVGSVNSVVSFDRDLQGRVFAVNLLNGVINILESPDMVPGPTSLRSIPRAGFKPIQIRDIRLRPSEYTLQTLDGRTLHGRESTFNGMVLVRKKGSAEPAQLLPLTW